MMESKLIDIVHRRLLSLDYPGTMQQRHLAIALHDGKPITLPKYNYLQTKVCGQYVGSVHAEMNVMYSILKTYYHIYHYRIYHDPPHPRIKHRVILIVIRVNKQGELSNSKPCYHCLRMMKQLGIRQVFYSTGLTHEPYRLENVKTMTSDHQSRFFRCLHNSLN